MKKERLKGFISGVVVSSMVFALSVSAFAATGSKTIQVAYDNIKIYINEKLTPMMTDGQTVEPFTYGGRTYVPLNAVAAALGQQVSWDDKTKSIYIGSQPTKSQDTEIGLVNENGLKIAYTGITKAYTGSRLNFKLENTSSTNYTVLAEDFSIDGIMCNAAMVQDVAAGKSAIAEMLVTDTELKKIGQTSLSKFEIAFKYYNSDTYTDAHKTSQIKVNADAGSASSSSAAAQPFGGKYPTAPASIYTTSAQENGLGDTDMMVTAKLEKKTTSKGYDVIYIRSNDGQIMLTNSTSAASWNSLQVGKTYNFVFTYLGFSSVSNTAAGDYVQSQAVE